MAWMASGRLGFSLMPRVESNRAGVTANLPVGSPISQDREVRTLLLAALDRVREREADLAVFSTSAEIEGNSLSIIANLDTTVENNSVALAADQGLARGSGHHRQYRIAAVRIRYRRTGTRRGPHHSTVILRQCRADGGRRDPGDLA